MILATLSWSLPLSVGLPLLLACMLCSARARPWVMRFAVVASLPALFSSLIAIRYEAPTIVIDLPWLLMGSHLMLDATGQVFLFLTAIVWLASALYAVSDSRNIEHRMRFYVCFLLAMAGNIGVTLAGDLATFYTLFALMSFAAYGIIVTNDSAEVVHAGRVYITLVIIGEVVLFSAFVNGVQASGSTTFAQWQSMAPAAVTVPLIVLALGIKLGVIPWHFVLPVTYRVTPNSAAVALSGAMLNAGLLGWFRLLPLGQVTLSDWGSVLVVLGLIASFVGVLFGLMQQSAKALLGYSSVSQVGLMTSVVGLALIDHVQWGIFSTVLLIYALHHALAKGALFFATGVKKARGPLSYYWHCLALVLPALAIAGAPLTTGALAKSAFKSAVIAVPEPWAMWFAILLPLSSIATSLLMIRFVRLVWPVRAEVTNHANLAVAGQAILIASVAVGAWLFAGVKGFDSLAAAMKIANLWASTWPIVVAVVMFIGFAWTVKKYSLS
ncbi:complex I subunit 5 family protein, partial [Kaarinaea lacus]